MVEGFVLPLSLGNLFLGKFIDGIGERQQGLNHTMNMQDIEGVLAELTEAIKRMIRGNRVEGPYIEVVLEKRPFIPIFLALDAVNPTTDVDLEINIEQVNQMLAELERGITAAFYERLRTPEDF